MTTLEFSAMVQKYQSLVYTVCHQLVPDAGDAQDLTQETFLAAWRAIDRCPSGFEKQWLGSIAANKAKDYLRAQRSQIRALEIKIEAKLERECRLRSRLSKVTPITDGMPRSKGMGDVMAQGVAELEEIGREIDGDLQRLARMRRRLDDFLSAIPDEFQRAAAQMKYSDGLTYEALAERMDISVRWAYVLIDRAMKALEAQWNQAGLGPDDGESA